MGERVSQTTMANAEENARLAPIDRGQNGAVFTPSVWARVGLAAGIAAFGGVPSALALGGVTVPAAVVVTCALVATGLTAAAVELGMRAGTKGGQ